jgi:AraC family transcriptional regulator
MMPPKAAAARRSRDGLAMAVGPDAAEMMVVEAELRLPLAIAQLTRFNLPSLDYSFVAEDRAWVDLCHPPRPSNTRARFRDRWSPHRFEKVGSVFVMPRGEAMQFRTDGGPQRSIVCQFASERVREWLSESLDWTPRLEAGLDISNETVRALMRRLAEELHAPGFASEAMAELILGQIAIELARFSREVGRVSDTGGLATWRLRRIDERLAEVRAAPTLAELAQTCNMSVRQLTRAFRAARGCSIGDYVNRSRIEAAKRLLARDESIKGIALSMGFSSASHFSQAFRRATGVSPRTFRARRAWS